MTNPYAPPSGTQELGARPARRRGFKLVLAELVVALLAALFGLASGAIFLIWPFILPALGLSILGLAKADALESRPGLQFTLHLTSALNALFVLFVAWNMGAID